MVKTLIMETDSGDPLVVLMHGDKEVFDEESGEGDRREIGPSLRAGRREYKHSGYFIGGTSPFGTRRRMPVYAESTIFDLDDIHINAGHRGLMLKIESSGHRKGALDVTRVEVGDWRMKGVWGFGTGDWG